MNKLNYLNKKVKAELKAAYFLFFRFFWRTLGLVISSLLFRVEITGKENLPKNGPYIIAANHQNFLDGILLSFLFTPQVQPFFIIHRRAIQKFAACRIIVRTIECAITDNDRNEIDTAYLQLRSRLASGGIVGIFPEGEISGNPIPRKFKPGVAKLAVDSGVPVIPIHINGTYNLRNLSYWFKRSKVTANVGMPIYASCMADCDLDGIAAYLRGKVIELNPELSEEFKIPANEPSIACYSYKRS